MMKQKTFNQLIAALFLLAGVVHLARALMGWTATMGNWTVPAWVSWVGAVVALYLAYNAYRLSKQEYNLFGMIRKVKEGYRVVAESGRNMGTYKKKEDAEKRLRQIEMFKHLKKR